MAVKERYDNFCKPIGEPFFCFFGFPPAQLFIEGAQLVEIKFDVLAMVFAECISEIKY